MWRLMRLITLVGILLSMVQARSQETKDLVKVESGTLRGTTSSDRQVRIFKGVPFAAAPVGGLRWKAPQPASRWLAVRQADKFGSPCMQTDVFGDIYFREAQPSEDCLFLNIWMPARPESGKLAVFLWFYGGGFVAGTNSEPRYDGEALAKKGVIVVEPNYRLGVFGYFSHPALAKESGHNSSGNYGLMDQYAALQWVVKNIAAFGGDPGNITIGGESAGSLSVSALMASPLSRNLFQKAIGESGAFFSSPREGPRVKSRAETEEYGQQFAESLGAHSLAEMRAKPANELLEAAAKRNRGFDFWPNVDGYYLPEAVSDIFAKGEQSRARLLAGWNADEAKMGVLLAPGKPTAKSFEVKARERFGDQADEFLKLYTAKTDDEALASAEALAGDDFIAFATWKWIDMQRKTAKVPVYQYLFAQLPAVKPGAKIGILPASEAGARHAGEIEYVFGTLKSQEGVPWTEDDFKVSEAMGVYWTNFVKQGDPNGNGLPQWPQSDAQDGYQVMHLSGKNLHAAVDSLRPRYEFLDAHASNAAAKAGGAK
jgi:para-nitrobenzyl esterase